MEDIILWGVNWSTGIESKKGLRAPVVTITSEVTISWHSRSKISKK